MIIRRHQSTDIYALLATTTCYTAVFANMALASDIDFIDAPTTLNIRHLSTILGNV